MSPRRSRGRGLAAVQGARGANLLVGETSDSGERCQRKGCGAVMPGRFDKPAPGWMNVVMTRWGKNGSREKNLLLCPDCTMEVIPRQVAVPGSPASSTYRAQGERVFGVGEHVVTVFVTRRGILKRIAVRGDVGLRSVSERRDGARFELWSRAAADQKGYVDSRIVASGGELELHLTATGGEPYSTPRPYQVEVEVEETP